MADSQLVLSNEKRRVRLGETRDAEGVADIYNHYIRDSVITFEEEPVTPAEMRRRMAEVRSFSLPWLVAEDCNQVVGYAYATRWKARSAYRYSVETTVYIAPECVGRGVGSLLYGDLIHQLKALGLHTAIGGIALPNEASVTLHERFGFRKVGEFNEVGYKFDRWIDVGYWQLTL